MGYEVSGTKVLAFAQEKSRLARELYEAAPKVCRRCSTIIPYEKRANSFCSQTCGALGNQYRRIYPGKCSVCGKRVSAKSVHCVDCNGVSKRKSLADAKTDKTRRARLEDECGHICGSCGTETWMGQSVPLELDHIDGNHTNNDRSNLRLLCPNCHAQPPTYKNKNAGNGRVSRRKASLQ